MQFQIKHAELDLTEHPEGFVLDSSGMKTEPQETETKATDPTDAGAAAPAPAPAVNDGDSDSDMMMLMVTDDPKRKHEDDGPKNPETRDTKRAKLS